MHHVHTCTSSCVFVRMYVFLVQVSTCILLKMELKTWGEVPRIQLQWQNKLNFNNVNHNLHSNNKKKTLFAHSEIYAQRDNIECEIRYYWQRRKILPEVLGCSPFSHEILKSYRGIIFLFLFLFFYLSASLIEMHRSRGPKKFKPQANSNKVKPQRNTN